MTCANIELLERESYYITFKVCNYNYMPMKGFMKLQLSKRYYAIAIFAIRADKDRPIDDTVKANINFADSWWVSVYVHSHNFTCKVIIIAVKGPIIIIIDISI